MTKAILLDVDNTLLDFNASAREAAILTARDFSVPLPKDFFPVFKEINDKLWLKIEDGSLDKQGLHRMRWATIFASLGVDFDGVVFEEQFRQNMAFCAVPVEGAEELLTYLKAKYPLYVASNASAALQASRLRLAELDEFFTDKFLSEDIGVAKPDERFWAHCANALALSPSELIMIGDSPSADIKGAHAFGIKTIWYNHDKMNVCGVPADHVVYSLSDVKKSL